MVAVDLNVVEDVVGTASDGRPLCQLLFGVDHLVGTVAQEEFLLDIGGGPGDDHSGAQLLEQAGGLQTALEIVADGHDAYIVIVHAQAAEELLVGAVADLGSGGVGQNLLDQLLLVIHRHDLMVQLPQLHGDVLSKPAQADEQDRFHSDSSYIATIDLKNQA